MIDAVAAIGATRPGTTLAIAGDGPARTELETHAARLGLGDRVREINFKATKLALEARELAGQAVFVAGAVGPSGKLNVPLVPDDDARLVALRALFRDQIAALADGELEMIEAALVRAAMNAKIGLLVARYVMTPYSHPPLDRRFEDAC